MTTATVKKASKKAPVATSPRKRPSKKFIAQMVAYRGFMTANEKTQIATLSIRNTLQKINNRAMADDVTVNFTSAENAEIQKLIKDFVKGVDLIIDNK